MGFNLCKSPWMTLNGQMVYTAVHNTPGRNVRLMLVILTYCLLVLNLQTFCADIMSTWQQNWTHALWQCTCINVTRWRSETFSQFSLWEIDQSKPSRRCWTSSWNNLTLSTCVSSTNWNRPINSTSVRHWSKTDIKVSVAVASSCRVFFVFCRWTGDSFEGNIWIIKNSRTRPTRPPPDAI